MTSWTFSRQMEAPNEYSVQADMDLGISIRRYLALDICSVSPCLLLVVVNCPQLTSWYGVRSTSSPQSSTAVFHPYIWARRVPGQLCHASAAGTHGIRGRRGKERRGCVELCTDVRPHWSKYVDVCTCSQCIRSLYIRVHLHKTY